MATQSRIGWRPYVTQVVNAVDADATAFIAAAGITNLTQAAAINTLVNDLKTYGLWTKMKALYPMVGGSAASHKFNLKDPRDLNEAYRLVFNGGWAHTSTGAKPNGTTGYANTFLNESIILLNNNSHVSVYSRTDLNSTSCDIGVTIGAVESNIYAKIGSIFYPRIQANNGGVNVGIVSSQAFYLSNRVNESQVFGYRNTTKYIVSSNSLGRINNVFYLAANHRDGTPQHLSSREQAFASIGDGLTDTEATNFYNSVQKFQTTLGRQIGSPIVSDTDAQAFLNAASITDLGQANAVNTLVVDLKADGVWTKMKALYPFVGGTAAAHKFNLKDPRDLDAAYRLTFTGGWTHTAGGALSNGTTGYANTFYGAGENITNGNGYLGYYTNSTTDASVLRVSNMASIETSIYQGSGVIGYQVWPYSNTTYTTSLPGLNMGGRFTSGSNSGTKLYKNGTLVVTQYPTFGNIGTNKYFYLAARNTNNTGADGFGVMNFQFTFMSDTLTDSEASVFYTAVQKYQTSLGRQSGTPVLATGQTAGLLDTYSGASAAYSLRKLRNGYYGNAIRVRRSSDNSEQDIAFKADGTLDTVSLLAFVGSGNGFVTTWYDQSGNEYNAYQSTAINQPLIVNGGSVILENGRPTVSFTTSHTLSTATQNLSFYDCAISYVSKNISRTAYACGIFGYGTNTQGSRTRYLGVVNNTLSFIYYGADFWSNFTGMGDTKLTLYSLNFQSNSVNFYKNSSTQTGSQFNLLNTTSSSFAINDIYGRGEMANINFSEGIFYTTGQSTNMNGIRSNQNSYYSIY